MVAGKAVTSSVAIHRTDAAERSLDRVLDTLAKSMGNYLTVFRVLGTKDEGLSLNFGRVEVKSDKPNYFHSVL